MQAGVEQCDDGNDDETDGCTSACTSASCGDGFIQAGEQCDDGNPVDTDECPSTCQLAYCGDGFIQQDSLEQCDDGNTIDSDACTSVCKPAKCGDGVIQEGVEQCDDGNLVDTDACTAACTINVCGDGVVHEGVEQCDDGNMLDDDGCTSDCTALCANPGGGELTAENGTNMNVLYCYSAEDSLQKRAQKACESHFGVGQCCVILNGYNGQQYGQCGADGGPGSIHWHWDAHPDEHCKPFYVPGDVVSPGWCGLILGSFTD
ncbi:MAG TPA: DUF4215 domain-containing protein [Enhygromyxa sp.]|nr:DUF4215 domain-containing protein [Enhygromyxa sp.]